MSKLWAMILNAGIPNFLTYTHCGKQNFFAQFHKNRPEEIGSLLVFELQMFLCKQEAQRRSRNT